MARKDLIKLMNIFLKKPDKVWKFSEIKKEIEYVLAQNGNNRKIPNQTLHDWLNTLERAGLIESTGYSTYHLPKRKVGGIPYYKTEYFLRRLDKFFDLSENIIFFEGMHSQYLHHILREKGLLKGKVQRKQLKEFLHEQILIDCEDALWEITALENYYLRDIQEERSVPKKFAVLRGYQRMLKALYEVPQIEKTKIGFHIYRTILFVEKYLHDVAGNLPPSFSLSTEEFFTILDASVNYDLNLKSEYTLCDRMIMYLKLFEKMGYNLEKFRKGISNLGKSSS